MKEEIFALKSEELKLKGLLLKVKQEQEETLNSVKKQVVVLKEKEKQALISKAKEEASIYLTTVKKDLEKLKQKKEAELKKEAEKYEQNLTKAVGFVVKQVLSGACYDSSNDQNRDPRSEAFTA